MRPRLRLGCSLLQLRQRRLRGVQPLALRGRCQLQALRLLLALLGLCLGTLQPAVCACRAGCSSLQWVA